MTIARQPQGIPAGGQFAANTHAESGLSLAPRQQEEGILQSLASFDAATSARKQELRAAAAEIDKDRSRVGAALAAVELKKAFPTAGAVRFHRIPTRGQGVAVNPEILTESGTPVFREDSFGTLLDAPEPVRRPLETALSHLSSVYDDDLEAQGIKKIQRPHGTVYELNFNNALELAAARGVPSGAAAMDQKQALDLSTLTSGSRTLGPELHGLPGVDTLTLKNLGPSGEQPGRNIISLTFTLPESANIRDLYDDGRDQKWAHWEAQRAASEMLGYMQFPEKSLNGLPGDELSLDGDGNITIEQYDFFRPVDSIDPDDLRSWAKDLQQFSNPESRARLRRAINEARQEG